MKAARAPWVIRDLARFRRLAQERGMTLPEVHLRPVTGEATAATAFDTHYVYHCAWATRVLARTRPGRHVDVSSSLYFVALASALLPIEHLDFRPPDLRLPNVTVRAGDLMKLPYADCALASLSCMHVVEHIGLGRYGDVIDPDGRCSRDTRTRTRG